MLEKLTLTNFRGFSDHEVPLRDATIVVGRNNAGKSTIVEALRLVSIVVSRYRKLGFHPAPTWTGVRDEGVHPALRNMEITFDGMFYRYSDPPSVIVAGFSGGQSVTIYIADEQRFHAVIRDSKGRVVKSRQRAIEANLPTVAIMPQVAPVQKNEVILSEDYVKAAMSSSLAPLHFRNQLAVFYDSFAEFRDTVTDTWPGVAVEELIGYKGLHGERLHLQVRNEDFVGEVALMGHGLQMWLQTMWFLTLFRHSQTIILDEPDVYMHPDLQRRLIRFLRHRHPQYIVTTHSVEILSEVQSEEILVVDRRGLHSRFAVSIPAVQRLIENIGSVNNIHLTRLWSARKVILVEGKDLSLLKVFQNTLFPNSLHGFDALPSMSIGGWGGWRYAVGSAMLLRNAMGESITTYCVLDSDYHTPEEIQERRQDAEDRNVRLHIWSSKEIENYLLDPAVIQRVIAHSVTDPRDRPAEHTIRAKLVEIAESLRDEIFDNLSTEILSRDRRMALSSANKQARKRIESVQAETGIIFSLIPGKTAISRLSEWSQGKFGVYITPLNLAREMFIAEIPQEVASVIASIESNGSFEDQLLEGSRD